MEVLFADEDLDRLEVDANFSVRNMPQGIVKAYRNRMQIIRAAPDERDFYKFRSLRFEKLEGKRKHQHSMRLNDQYRLVLELLEGNSQRKIVKIISIEDYH
jgi:proteic killer suppression protein